MAEPELARARRGAETRGARSDDRDLDGLGHARAPSPPLRLVPALMQTNARTGILIPLIAHPWTTTKLDATRTMSWTKSYALESGKRSTGEGQFSSAARRSQ
ncbi:hypothetical protein GCM10009115_18810 [Sphingopyxis soli]|uniref:Uncharacterized protein n=1 Tax=Sphingopyxis soli TaxID=592051 RepID=A0ABN1M5D9_9SPHN